MASLQQQLSKLDAPGPAQLYAVTAVFDTIADAPASTAEPAIQRCLCLPDRPAVGVATDKLLALVHRQKINAASAQALLLTALSVSTPATAPLLAACTVDIFISQHGSGSGGGGYTSSNSGNRGSGQFQQQRNVLPQNWTWRSHPLTKVILASPYAGPAVVSSICQHLSVSASASVSAKDGSGIFNAMLASLHTFISCVLLDRHLAAQQPQLATVLRTALARLGSSLSEVPRAQTALLTKLAAILPALPVKTAQDQESAACFVCDFIDLLEACEEEPERETVHELSCSLVELCCEVLHFGGQISEMVGALAVLAGHWPEEIAPAIAVDLVRMVVAGAGGKEELSALSLLCTLLESTTEALYESPASEKMRIELVPQLAFSQNNTAKQWTSRALALLAQQPQTAQLTSVASKSGLKVVPTQVPATADQAAVSLLRCLWSDCSEACRWLQSVQSQATQAAELKSKTSTIDSSTASIIFSLLHHQDSRVQEVAVDATLAAVEACPTLGITALPIIIHKLYTLVETFLSGKSGTYSPPTALLSTLYALPHLARHPSAMPFVVRALHPLLAPTSPPLLQAVALRMLCTMWTTTGRGFPHLRAAVLSYPGIDEAGSAPKDPALRRAWAATLSDICTHSGEDKAGELVHAVFICLKTGEDEDPCVAAAGLECVAALCESDTLDFYKAWSVVRPLFPTLPTHPEPAAAWVRLLASGGLDAGFHPEIARGVVDALWVATGHTSPIVRRQAYASLAAFNMGVLESIDALSPLCEYAGLLQRENDPDALEECEGLVMVALKREHATRRRLAVTGTEQQRRRRGALSTTNRLHHHNDASGVIQHRLSASIPRLMLGVGGSGVNEFLRRVPDVPPPATLFFWAPPPPQHSKSALLTAAKEACTGYGSVFSALCGLLEEPMFTLEGSSASAGMVVAWTPFIRRWLAAQTAALKNSSEKAGSTNNNASDAPSSALWEVIFPILSSPESSVSRAVNATWAVAALCTAHPQPPKLIIPAVHAALLNAVQEGTAIATQSAAAATLGHCIEAVRVVVGLPAAVECMDLLCSQLHDAHTPAAIRASCAVGIGLACKQLYKAVGSTGVRDMLLKALGAIVGVVVSTAGQTLKNTPFEGELGRLLGKHLMIPENSDIGDSLSVPREVVVAALHALSDAMPAVLALDLPQLASVLQTIAIGMLEQPAPSPAACATLRATTLVAYKSGVSSSNDVVDVLKLLLDLTSSGFSPANSTATAAEAAAAAIVVPNGRLVGAAASALGNLIPALVREGFAFDSSTPAPHECLEALLAAVEGAERCSGVAAAKAGAACGIAALLRGALGSSIAGYGSDGTFAAMMKGAVDVLETLALKDTDPRTKRACSWVLAELSWHIRQQSREGGASSDLHAVGADGAVGAVGGASLGTAGTAASTLSHIKGLGALPEDGALRLLCETAVTGTWPLLDSSDGEEDEHPHSQEAHQQQPPPLTALQAAAVVRCIAAAARLPALDWTSVCRRLLRAWPGDSAVQESCIDLAALHAAVSPAYQLYDFVSGDLLSISSLRVLGASSQAMVLKHLPELLAAVPLDEARGALHALCDLCSREGDKSTITTTGGAATGVANKNALSWQTALAQGLAGLAESSSSLLASDARKAALTRALQKVHPPKLWNLQIGSNSTLNKSEKSVFEEENELLWSALFRCAASMSTDEAASLCSDASLYASHPVHYSWLAASLVASGRADLRSLQHSRNMILNGHLVESPAQEESTSLLITWALTLGSQGSHASKVPLIVKQQWLVDVVGGVEKCNNPEGAVRLAVCGVVGIACAMDQAKGVVGGFQRAMWSIKSAILALPAAMARLAEAEAPPLGLLCSLVAVLPLAAVDGVDCVWLQRRCCHAMRHGVAPDVWNEMYEKL